MQTLRSLEALEREGLVAPDPRLADAARSMAIAITPEMLGLIDRADAGDPIARQFVPSVLETEVAPEELSDPIGDEARSPVKGIVHRYPDRVLLKPLHVCPVYCRFCFRREKVGPGGEALSADELDQALAYIHERREIWEVILTGGDPLMMAPRRLGELIAALDATEHVGVIRIHSRVPVADPARITDALVEALAAEKAVFVVLHCNHARELTAAARQTCRRIIAAGVPMLAQSVLLKGVNDDPQTLEALLRALVATRIKPYYLHHADLAPGTARFRTTIAAGQALLRDLRGRVSGLCQPTYVLDIPGGFGKVPIGPCYVSELADGTTCVEDPNGRKHPAT